MNQREIAEALDLSKGTVSLALSGSPLVGEDTRRRVLELAKRSGYRPNLAARSITTGKTMSVGLIMPSIVHPFNAALVDGAQKHLLDAGYFGLYYPSNHPGDYTRALDALIPRRVDGIIAIATHPDMIEFLENENVPAVFYSAEQDGVDEVTLDLAESGWLAARHLESNGHTRLAFMGPTETDAGFSARFKGYCDAAKQLGLVLRSECIKSFIPGFGGTGARQGYDAMKELLALSRRPTAVFTHNDQLAIGAMRAVFESGLSIPSDVSIIGHDDTYECLYGPVTLTSIALPTGEITRELVKLLLDKIQHRSAGRKPRRIALSPSLVIRESTGPAGEKPIARYKSAK
jgi:DNA-binding LacI/PurR family transcriptional regulator